MKAKTGLGIVMGFTLAGHLAWAQTETPDVAGQSAAASSAATLEPTHLHLGLIPLPWDARADVTGVSFSLLGDRVGQVKGLQLSSLFNHAGGPSSGVQLTGLGKGGVNYTGWQTAGLMNLTGGYLRGVQVTGVFNGVGQGGRGLQIAGVGNISAGSFTGLQLAGGLNTSADLSGAQVAATNVAVDAHGVQLGAVNAVGSIEGAQVGVINVAGHARGFTFGVINLAREHDGEAFGLLTLVGNGIHNVAVYSTETMLSNVAIKLGTRHLYTSWMIGYHPGDHKAGDASESGRFAKNSRRLGVGFGVGYRFDLGGQYLRFLEIEGNGMTVGSKLDAFADDAPLLTSARVVLGVDVAPHVTIIAGVAENVTVATGGRDLDVSRGGLEKVMHHGDTTVRMFPGLLLGLQL